MQATFLFFASFSFLVTAVNLEAVEFQYSALIFITLIIISWKLTSDWKTKPKNSSTSFGLPEMRIKT
mgnify:CR=1 FL=1